MINEDLIKKISNDLISSLKTNKITLKMAKEILEKSERKAELINVPVVITIVDDGGNLIAQHRMDDSLLISIKVSFSKAYTAIALKMSTEKLNDLVIPGKPLYGLENVGHGELCILGGGIPIVSNGNIIGAIGVSGGSIDEDIQIAQAALE
ncbi:GlcG/HbpS family heme-binding protein [Clostridium beijerinckii]|uniref:GlcG/HbpS family heme-binding protein n=1 Tax=Clostridium beijerinckii TaxID=1520 RepID=UPI0004795C7F|nr:heme-binding protein [Clostridium beijerinckii]